MTCVSDLPLLLPAVLIWLMHFKCCFSLYEERTIIIYRDKNISIMNYSDYNISIMNYSDYNISMNYSDYNISNIDYDDFPELCVKELNRKFRLWFMPTFYSIICLLGLKGNLLVILTFFYFKRLKTMTDVYLLNLSFADLLFALSLPFWAANSMTEWKLGLLVCKAMHTVYKVSFYSSMFILSFISVERYFVITKAISAHRYRSQAVFLSKVSSVAIWVMALIFSIPEMKYTTINNDTCTPYSSSSDKLRVSIQASQIVLAFALPLLVMGICYSGIVQTLCQSRSFERNRAIRVILAVVAVFLVCQVPYNLVLFLSTVVTAKGGTIDCRFENNLLYATDVTQCLAFLRCCLNPFVYAFIGVKFRHDLLKLLKDLGCMSHEMFFKYTLGEGRRRSSLATDTETTTTFSP
ncbi:C-C chemokine receptor type 7 [Sander vitreus]